MRLDKNDRLVIYVNVLSKLVGRPGAWPTETPPARDGTTKTVSKAFAVAVWAAAVTRAAVHVLEHEDETPQTGGSEGSGPSGSDTPF